MRNFTFCGGCKQGTTKVSRYFWTRIWFFGIQFKKSSLPFDKVQASWENRDRDWKNANSLFKWRFRRRKGCKVYFSATFSRTSPLSDRKVPPPYWEANLHYKMPKLSVMGTYQKDVCNPNKMVLNWFNTILRNFLLLFSSFQTASLPGRIDQINHLLRPGSLQNRPISPISILRDSRPVSPLVFNSNHTSPTPSPSPERDPYPPTPPIRYQDFSPVKSEDDTGIHSGSSESDHEVIGKGQ